MTIKYHTEEDGSPLIQGSDAWKAARCGRLTASEMKLIITPTLKVAVNEKATAHLYELLGQRITRHVEERYISEDMLRGMEDEIEARSLYNERYATVQEVGFITNDKWGFTLGYSPDGLVGTDGLIECKSRRQKYQVQTITDHAMPDDYLMQVQTGLLVSEREWLDFVSFSAGLPMLTIRVEPIPNVQAAILDAAYAFEKRMAEKMDQYRGTLASARARLIQTERRAIQEMYA
jgi:predicted phage-related endonuclease